MLARRGRAQRTDAPMTGARPARGITCESVARYRSPYLDSELAARATGDVDTHCEHCGACRDRLDADRCLDAAVHARLRRIPGGAAAFWERVQRSLRGLAEQGGDASARVPPGATRRAESD